MTQLLNFPWLILLGAGLLETIWAVSLKYSAGFTRLGPSVVTITALAGSIFLLALALHRLPVGTAYAVWTGIGAAGTVVLGVAMMGESLSPARLAFLLCIVIGLIGLKVTA